MASALVWFVFSLGVAHIVFGVVKFKRPLLAAVSAGYVGQFGVPEVRRSAFWFVIFGPLLMLAGHMGIHAVAVGDLALLKLLGIYTFVIALVGVTAFPKSPFWAALFVSPLLIAAGYGLLP